MLGEQCIGIYIACTRERITSRITNEFACRLCCALCKLKVSQKPSTRRAGLGFLERLDQLLSGCLVLGCCYVGRAGCKEFLLLKFDPLPWWISGDYIKATAREHMREFQWPMEGAYGARHIIC